MTEREIFIENIPQIAEIIVMIRGWNRQQYEEWKADTLVRTPPGAVGFIRKVFIVIERCIEEGP